MNRFRFAATLGLGIALVDLAGAARSGEPDPPALASRSRQPSALVLSRDGARLYVANRRSGGISVVDPRTARVVAEHDVGRGLADLAALPDGRHLLAVDETDDAILLLELSADAVTARQRLSVPPGPVSVRVLGDGSACVVASLRSQCLTFLTWDGSRMAGAPTLRTSGSLDLPFPPRLMASVREGKKLIVADAFGGRLAVVDVERKAVESVRGLGAHNIRGLAAAPDGLSVMLAHQVLQRAIPTDHEGVHWGRLMGNFLRVLSVDSLLSARSDADLIRDARLIDLGGFGNAAGDPAAIAFDRAGGLAIALAGVDGLALAEGPSAPMRRVGVGRRPTALAVSPEDGRWYVADSLDDTVSVVDPVKGRRLATIRLGPRPERDEAGRGERLFSDARLSHDGWMSCASCHADGHTIGLRGDTLGDGDYGASKLIPTLLGVGDTGPWGWDGRFARLEDQIRQSIASTMQGTPPTDSKVADLAAFLRALAPASPSAPAGERETRGRAVFRAQGCAECHAPPQYTTPKRYDVGLADENGRRRFNPPSLRGVGARGTLLHDGRAGTLEDVFLKHRHPNDTDWDAAEVADLAAFLKTL